MTRRIHQLISRWPISHWLILSIAWTGISACVSPHLAPQPRLQTYGHTMQLQPAAIADPALRVMTVNLAHARGTGLHQALQNEERARANLDAVRAVIQREAPQVVALQEADASSAWSGAFDHVDYLAETSGFASGLLSIHAEGGGQTYGTALLTQLPVVDKRAYTFAPAVATFPKGFSLLTVRWPAEDELVDLVSLHLEPLRTKVRQEQARQLIAALADRGRPLIIMGDFNTEWDHRDGVLDSIIRDLDLQTFRQQAEDLATYPRFGRRLDWILASQHFEFAGFSVLPDRLSDHRAVMALLRPRPEAPMADDRDVASIVNLRPDH